MSTVERRAQAKALIDRLSGAQLRVASEFLAFVKERPADAATLELLSIPGFAHGRSPEACAMSKPDARGRGVK